MKITTKGILGWAIAIIIVSIIIWAMASFWLASIPTEYTSTSILFERDLDAKTLTVTEINSSEPPYWNDVVIWKGNATLPEGSIDVGDIVTDCEGIVSLVYEPENIILGGEWSFE